MNHDREIAREIRQKQRALATGALVRPPRTETELVLEERANAAEIDHLTTRRQRLWKLLSENLTSLEREQHAYDADAATRSLELAFAARRRLRVARTLFRSEPVGA